MKSLFSQKYKDYRWTKKREEIIARDFNMCWDCHDKEPPLQVHHIYYDFQIENPWEYPDDSLITLCKDCHKIEHDRLRKLDVEWCLQKEGLRATDFENLIGDISKIIHRRKVIDDLKRERFANFSKRDPYEG